MTAAPQVAQSEIIPEQEASRPWTMVWLIACICLACAVRSHGLGSQSLWWDESLSLARATSTIPQILASTITLTDGVTSIQTVDVHPPLYFLILSIAVRFLGNTEFALRFLSLVCSILLIPLTYVMGRRLLGDLAGRFAALAASLSPMYLWYSQEARMYMLAPLIGLISLYALLRLLQPESRRRGGWALVYIVAVIAMFATHYLTILLFAVEALVILLVALRSSRLGRGIWLLVVIIIAAVPIGLYVVTRVPVPAAEGGFSFIPLPILLRDVLNSFSLGLSVNVDDVLFLDLIFLLVAVYGLLSWSTERMRSLLPAGLILFLCLLLPIGLVYLAGYVRPIYMNSRHLIFITPMFYLALGAGLAALSTRRGIFAAVLAAMAVGSIFSWGQYFTNPMYHKDDHRAWGDYLGANAQPGDLIIVNPPHIYELYQYYVHSDAAWIGLPAFNHRSEEATAERLDALSLKYANIWLALSYTPPWGDPERDVETWLDQNLVKTDQHEFHTYQSVVRVERYTTRPVVALAPPPIDAPADIDLGSGYSYLGYSAITTENEPGRSFSFSVFLRNQQRDAKDIKISLRLMDQAGQLWGQTDHPVGTLGANGRWSNGAILRQDASLMIPLGTPSGPYQVEMVAYDAGTGLALATSGTSATQALGKVVVTRPGTPPAVADLPIRQRIGMHAEGFTLLGVDLAAPALSQGGVLTFDAYWRLDRQPAAEYLLDVSLAGDQGRAAVQRTFAIAGVGQSTLGWQRGDVLRGQYQLMLPRDLPAGRYSLRLMLQNASNGEVIPLEPQGWRRLLPDFMLPNVHVTVEQRQRVFTAPPISHPLSANLGGLISVLGYDTTVTTETPMQPGQTVTVTLYFQAQQTMDTGYSTFIHFEDDAGNIWGQQDLPAGSLSYPTSLWLPGEVVSTTMAATIAPTTSAERLIAVAGVYDATTSVRLPLAGAPTPTDSINLFSIDILR